MMMRTMTESGMLWSSNAQVLDFVQLYIWSMLYLVGFPEIEIAALTSC